MIETRDLSRNYGPLRAVNRLNLQLQAGDVFGLVGPTGSGKTTTLRMLATLLRPDAGDALICGKSILTHAREIRPLIGYLPQVFEVDDGLTVGEYLDFFAAAYQIKESTRRQVCDEKLELVELNSQRDVSISSLSPAQRQRLGLAQAILREPRLLLLDEPARELDQVAIYHLIQRLITPGQTVIICSQRLQELGDICNRIGILVSGQLILEGPVDELLRKPA